MEDIKFQLTKMFMCFLIVHSPFLRLLTLLLSCMSAMKRISWNVRTFRIKRERERELKKKRGNLTRIFCQHGNGLMTSPRSWISRSRLLPSVNAGSYQLFHQMCLAKKEFLLFTKFFFLPLRLTTEFYEHYIEERIKKEG